MTLIYERYGILNSPIDKHQMHPIYAVHYPASRTQGHRTTTCLWNTSKMVLCSARNIGGWQWSLMSYWLLLVTGYSWLHNFWLEKQRIWTLQLCGCKCVKCVHGPVWILSKEDWHRRFKRWPQNLEWIQGADIHQGRIQTARHSHRYTVIASNFGRLERGPVSFPHACILKIGVYNEWHITL